MLYREELCALNYIAVLTDTKTRLRALRLMMVFSSHKHNRVLEIHAEYNNRIYNAERRAWSFH